MNTYWVGIISLLLHSSYRRNNNHEKFVGMGLNCFLSKELDKNYNIKEKKKYPVSGLGFAC